MVRANPESLVSRRVFTGVPHQLQGGGYNFHRKLLWHNISVTRMLVWYPADPRLNTKDHGFVHARTSSDRTKNVVKTYSKTKSYSSNCSSTYSNLFLLTEQNRATTSLIKESCYWVTTV